MNCYWPSCIHDGLEHCPYLTGEISHMANDAVTAFPILLECGCTGLHCIDGTLSVVCSNHQTDQVIVSFETREWHMTCGQCRTGKWTGNDRPAAARARNNHNNRTGHTQIMLDYMIPDHTKKLWAVHYGRKSVPARFMVIPRKEE